MTEIAHLQERIRTAERLAMRYQAEAEGMRRAGIATTMIEYSCVQDLQEAFERGFRDGRQILACADIGQVTP